MALPVLIRMLKQQGNGADWADLYRSQFASVSRSTYYRWVREVQATHGNGQARAIRRHARTPRALRLANKAPPGGAPDEQQMRFIATLPAAIEPGDLVNMSAPDIGAKLNACIRHAELVLDALTTQTDEGTQILDPVIYLRASDHLRRTVETMAKISEIIWDVRRTDAFHARIFEVMRRHDPALVREITSELETLNREWGIA